MMPAHSEAVNRSLALQLTRPAACPLFYGHCARVGTRLKGIQHKTHD
jgi:hypothetical protein